MKRYRTQHPRITGRRAFVLLDSYLTAKDTTWALAHILDALRDHVRADLDTARRAKGKRVRP